MGLEQGGWQQQPTTNNDLERLASVMKAVEQACAALQVHCWPSITDLGQVIRLLIFNDINRKELKVSRGAK